MQGYSTVRVAVGTTRQPRVASRGTGQNERAPLAAAAGRTPRAAPVRQVLVPPANQLLLQGFGRSLGTRSCC
jgi:hypothetical protein